MKMDDAAVYQGQHLLDRHEIRVDGVFNYAYIKLIYKKIMHLMHRLYFINMNRSSGSWF